jgi:hypothetical protein
MRICGIVERCGEKVDIILGTEYYSVQYVRSGKYSVWTKLGTLLSTLLRTS